jgi:phosphatidylserine/phosphatidylglycerophosphate/cardiolipin synthase-like enzyme
MRFERGASLLQARSIIYTASLLRLATHLKFMRLKSKQSTMKTGAMVWIFLFATFVHAQTILPDIKVYFSPHGGCTEAVVRSINGAKNQVLVEAYSFTSEPIAMALIAAEKRGVDVEVILDKSQEQARGSEADLISESGIPTFVDSAYRIAHDKVMVIDGNKVITGSFNFTRSAEEYNAENLIIISNDPPLAEQYTSSWRQHLAQSHPFHPGKSHHKNGSHSRYYGPISFQDSNG